MSRRRIPCLTLTIILWLVALAALLFMVGAPASAQDSIRYVATTGSDIGDCTDPNIPCCTVQYAVDQAATGDAIEVAAGLYTGVNSRPAPSGYQGSSQVTQVVFITKTLSIRGGYTTTNGFADPPDPEANPTTLDAQGQGRVLFIAGTSSPTVTGLQITGGDSAGQGGAFNENDAGGGVYVVTAAPSISDSQVFSNTAGYGGGGLYLSGSNAILSGNMIYSNAARYEGGGLWLFESAATLVDNILMANSAGGDSGGGLSLWHSDAELIRNVVGCNAAVLGGGMHLYDSAAMVSGNTVISNSASTYGGGLALHYSDAMLTGNRISDNLSGGRGGGLVLGHSDATLINNLIADNHAEDMGSALYIDDSFPRLLHTTLAHNTGGSGIGLTGVGYSIALTNSILVSHAIGIEIASNNTASLEATLWGTGTWANETDWGGGGTVVTGTVNIWGDPAFVDPDLKNYHIGSGSAALDTGLDAGITVDMDGQPRPSGASYDIGADEYWWRVYLPLVLRDLP